jgi:serine/threonine-protein kinase
MDPRILAQLEAALAQHLGPMAAVLVRRRAKTSETVEGLRAALAEQIDDEPSRHRFMDRTEALIERKPPSASEGTILAADIAASLSNKASGTKPRFDEAFLAAVETELALHLGPLARVLIRKYAATARDRAELFLLLSDNIADPGQRRAFIRKSVAAFKDKR